VGRILVTGGAGFLGQYLVRELAQAGHVVSVIDLKPSAFPVLDIVPLCERISYDVDVTKPESLRGHFDGVDTVYHLAGIVSFWKKHAALLERVNVAGTRTVLAEAARAGVRRIVHVSSVAAIGYGEGDEPVDEEFVFDWPQAQHKHYMRTKHLAEEEVRAALRQGTDVIVANPGLMWGPGDMTNSANLIGNLQRRKIPGCPPGGTNIVDVRDVARGLPLVEAKGRSGERYILGGENIAFRRVYDVIAHTLGVAPPSLVFPNFSKPFLTALLGLLESVRSSPPPLTADQMDSSFRCRYFRSDKARRELGWEPEISFERMITDTVAWLRSHALLPAQ